MTSAEPAIKPLKTIQHITSGCSMIAQTDYKHRHNQVAKIIHQKITIMYKLQDDRNPYYKYIPNTILENSTHKLYWNRSIIADKTVHHNRPDIILIVKNNKTVYLIDIAVPNSGNLQTTFKKTPQIFRPFDRN